MCRNGGGLLGVALLAAVLLAACGGGEGARGGDGAGGGNVAGRNVGGSPDGDVGGEIVVLAAASLREAFGALAEDFEAAHPGADVTLVLGASSDLAAQVVQGAPADVLATASEQHMRQVVDAGEAQEPSAFARNAMQVVVPADNPAGVGRLEDLARDDVSVALCQEQVPCGTTGARVLDRAGLSVTPVTLEADARATLTKVVLGEVDAALVYVTDVRAAGADVHGIAVSDDVNAATTYPIATLRGSGNRATAEAFVGHVLSPEGRQVLAEVGFERP